MAGLHAALDSGAMEATKLAKLLINEVSGVDDPANEIPGWMVAKSATALAAAPADAPSEAAPTAWEKIRNSIFATRKDDIDMTSEELTAALDERDNALVEKFADVVKAAVAPEEVAPEAATTPEAPVTPAVTAEAPTVEAPAALTADEITKAIQEALAPYNEILEKVIDRFEPIERQLGVSARQSLEGQDVQKPETPATPATKSAIATLLEKPVGSSVGSCLA